MKGKIHLYALLLCLHFVNIATSAWATSNDSQNDKRDKALVLKLLNTAEALKYSDPVKSLEFAAKAYDLALSVEYDSALVVALILKGTNYNALKKLDEAIAAGEKIMEVAARSHPLEHHITTGREILAVAYAQAGDFDKSSKLYFENLALYEEENNKVLTGRTLGNIGADFFEQRNFEKALEYTNKALEIGIETEDWPLVTDQYNNLAALYQIAFPDTGKAIMNYLLALSIAEKINDVQQQGINMLNLGRFYGQLQKYDSAFFYLNKSLTIFKKLDNEVFISDCYTALGTTYYSKGEIGKAQAFALESLKLGNKLGSIQTQFYASSLLHQISIYEGDSAKAYKYHLQEAMAADSLNSLSKNNELVKMEFQYKHDKMLKDQKIKQMRNYFLMGLIITGLALSMVIVLLIYSRQKIKIRNALLENENVESKLKFKSKELSINLLALLKKNELITDISKKLTNLEKETGEHEIKEAIRKISNEIKQTSDDRLWQEFSLRFSETNREFYDKLLVLYPDLTPSELKLCAYLRLNMTTKEISELTGQRTETLEKARYRLRRKFHMNNQENNLVTFLNQIE